MCRATSCKTCAKTTWAGCGNHVEDVMRHIPAAARCNCDRTAPREPASGGWFSRLFAKK
ncbi:hypothetical protein [Arthrobacter glacialis]|uniref:hypothetical protein n=1 Tax=Arthrobacter glacialis TaxID=1664 RepID=UPI0013FD5082|nr:hypothetical protein [Arthrobacter glacialis]